MQEKESRKTIMIVGASGGIGKAIADTLSRENADLILVGRRKDYLEEMCGNMSCHVRVIKCDVTDYSSVANLFEEIREKEIKLSGLVYCCGVWLMKPLKTMESGELDEVFKTNVFGFYEICRLFNSPRILEKGASIIGVSSISSLVGESGTSAYSMTKAAMNAMIRSLSSEFMKRSIRINGVLPGIVNSKMGQDLYDISEEEIKRINNNQPLGIIPVEEVAEMVKYLLSDKSRHMTGELVTISGGYRG